MHLYHHSDVNHYVLVSQILGTTELLDLILDAMMLESLRISSDTLHSACTGANPWWNFLDNSQFWNTIPLEVLWNLLSEGFPNYRGRPNVFSGPHMMQLLMERSDLYKQQHGKSFQEACICHLDLTLVGEYRKSAQRYWRANSLILKRAWIKFTT